MIVKDVMQQVSNRLDTAIDPLRMIDFESDQIEVPGGLVSLPNNIDYLGTYNQGMNTIVLLVTILVSKADDRVRRDQIAPYADSEGPLSVRQALETGSYTAFDVITVRSGSFLVLTINKVDYLALVLSCDVVGSGRI